MSVKFRLSGDNEENMDEIAKIIRGLSLLSLVANAVAFVGLTTMFFIYGNSLALLGLINGVLLVHELWSGDYKKKESRI